MKSAEKTSKELTARAIVYVHKINRGRFHIEASLVQRQG